MYTKSKYIDRSSLLIWILPLGCDSFTALQLVKKCTYNVHVVAYRDQNWPCLMSNLISFLSINAITEPFLESSLLFLIYSHLSIVLRTYSSDRLA
jgi:hypothetical protein